MKIILITLVSLFILSVLILLVNTLFDVTLSLTLESILLIYVVFCLFRVMQMKNMLAEENQYFIDSLQNIRNPVSLVKAPLNVAGEGDCPYHIKKELSTAIRNMELLDSYLLNLMGLRHIFVRPEYMDIAEYELGSFMRNRGLSLQGEALNLKIVFDFDYASVWMDAGKISPVIDKFIIHAIQYVDTEEGIFVQTSCHDDFWEIKIKDSGDGRLLKHYKRKQQRWLLSQLVMHNGMSGGALTDRLLNLCHGEMTIDDKEGDVSLRFPVSHPCRSISGGKDEGPSECLAEDNINAFLISSARKPAGRRVIVLADSDDGFRCYLEKCLSGEYTVRSFNNGVDAWESINEEYPDVVICDSILSGMGGEELSSRLKTSMDISFIPVILLGSPVDMDIRLKRQYSMADAFILKSCHPEDLKTEISVQIDNSRLLRKSFLQKVFGEEFLMKDAIQDANIAFINKVKEYVVEHLQDENLKVGEIAAETTLSRTSFFNKWKSLTGETPEQFIHKVRMEKARELLESGGYRINEIPEKVGLKDVKNFREKYKKYFGIMPMESKKMA